MDLGFSWRILIVIEIFVRDHDRVCYCLKMEFRTKHNIDYTVIYSSMHKQIYYNHHNRPSFEITIVFQQRFTQCHLGNIPITTQKVLLISHIKLYRK